MHAVDSFREGKTIVLTLKDKGVLQEEEKDVMVNMNLLRKKQPDYLPKKQPDYLPKKQPDYLPKKQPDYLPKKQPDYLPYAEDESLDDPMQQKPRSILCNRTDGPRELELEEIPAKLRLQARSLSSVAPGLASDYLTPEEMVTFKKTKRRVKKIRKKEKEVVTRDGDFGSRLRGRGRCRVSAVEEEKEPVPQPPAVGRHPVKNLDLSDEKEGPRGGPRGAGAAEAAGEGALLRQLRDSGEKVVETVKEPESRHRGWEKAANPERKGATVFNATSEFCRTFREIPTYWLDKERWDHGGSESDREENGGWSTVSPDEGKQQQDVSASSTPVLDEELITGRLAAALLLCQNKGLLEATVQMVARVNASNKSLSSAMHCIEEKMAMDDKYGRLEEDRGFRQDFDEKDGYKADVKTEYVDETGRKLMPKEAFHSCPTVSTARAQARTRRS
ncbi:hypothetical protein P7K49_004552 [Saguinus oedipus]|uniref:Uncharacterized protein n=1 Tax=Saguinus oedipus TaxID=9490 RepID=A0ABQ9W8G2_SAGOE|nr:hypothetical protein P7K49_004552 [Saguinus oedipus]